MDINKLIKLFRENGYKVTPQRLTVCKFIFNSEFHPTAEHIFMEIRKEHPSISLATIYNTLHLLKKLNLIQELGFEEGSIRYDPDVSHHLNIVCSICGKIYDYKSEKIDKFWSSLISDLKIKSEGQRIDLYHKCDECLNLNH